MYFCLPWFMYTLYHKEITFKILNESDRKQDIDDFIHDTWQASTLTFFYTPTHREGAILQSPCLSIHTFVTDISASTGRNDFIFDMWLWHGDLYRVSPFQVYCTSTSCLPCDLEFFIFAIMNIFVTDSLCISASTGRNDLIYGFGMVTCTVSPLSRFTAHLLPVYRVN